MEGGGDIIYWKRSAKQLLSDGFEMELGLCRFFATWTLDLDSGDRSTASDIHPLSFLLLQVPVSPYIMIVNTACGRMQESHQAFQPQAATIQWHIMLLLAVLRVEQFVLCYQRLC